MKILRLFMIIFFITSIISCGNEEIEEVNSGKPLEMDMKDNSLNLKKSFSSALVKVLKENEDIRALIKREALKKIDFDYDVLYQLIKDERLENGKSLGELLSKYLTLDELESINEQLPTLTILVPSLPKESFSAYKWDVENESPAVAIEISEDHNVLIYHVNGEEEVIPVDIIPGYPVVVVKENERMVVASALTRSNCEKIVTRSGNALCFQFLDDAFNNSDNRIVEGEELNPIISTRADPRPPVKPKVNPADYLPDNLKKIIDAYNVYQNTMGWQRDYIYYNISPTVDKGPFNYNFKEYIVGFELVGDGTGAYNKIADQNEDPKTTLGIAQMGNILKWTDGEFEFKATVYLGNKNGFGDNLATFFRIKPKDLFAAELEVIAHRPVGTQFKIIGLKPLRVNLSLPLFEWNLENYSSNIKIGIEEVDGQETTVATTTTSSEFATNFNFDVTLGEKVKIGAKFGSSTKETKTVSFQVTTTRGNDELGEVIINFADPIITNNDLTLITIGGNRLDGYTYDARPASYNSKYYTGWYRLYIAPKRTY